MALIVNAHRGITLLAADKSFAASYFDRATVIVYSAGSTNYRQKMRVSKQERKQTAILDQQLKD